VLFSITTVPVVARGEEASYLTVMVRACLAEAAGLAESDTWTVKFVVPAVVGVPLISPVLEIIVNPAGSVPIGIVQL
jgi:hypothetical protein